MAKKKNSDELNGFNKILKKYDFDDEVIQILKNVNECLLSNDLRKSVHLSVLLNARNPIFVSSIINALNEIIVNYSNYNDVAFIHTFQVINETTYIYHNRFDFSQIRSSIQDCITSNKPYIILVDHTIVGNIKKMYENLFTFYIEGKQEIISDKQDNSDKIIDFARKYKVDFPKDSDFLNSNKYKELDSLKPEIINAICFARRENDTQLRDKYFSLCTQNFDFNTEINKLIGQKAVKEELSKFITYLSYLKKNDLKLPSMNFEFVGNSGTGKTTFAKLLGKALTQNNILSDGSTFNLLRREDLVGQYIGETDNKLKEIIKNSLDSVLFIDEAYSLDVGTNLDYGSNVINILTGALDELQGRICVIFAGYTKEMNTFMKVNPGLSSRVKFQVHFSDYTTPELYEIFQSFNKYNITISKACKERIYNFFDEERKQQETFGNARLARNLYENVEMMVFSRLESERAKITERKLTIDDLNMAINYTIKKDPASDTKRRIGFNTDFKCEDYNE